MQAPTTPVRQDLVLIGGGHSHVTVLKRFGMDPVPGVRLTLICRDSHAPYSGMLPGLIAGHYEFDDAHIDLAPLARFAGARFLHDEVIGLDLDARRVSCRGRPPVAFDLLSINIGSRPGMAAVPGAAGAVIPVKPIDGFARRWREVRDKVLARDGETTLAFVGGGAGGVEVLLSIQYRLRRELEAAGRDAGHLRYALYTAADDILPTHNAGVRRRFYRVLGERGVEVHTGWRVASVVRDGQVMLTSTDGATAQADEVLWVTTAAAQEWPGAAGLAVDDRGFIRVRDTLQTLDDDRIFAAGDVAAVVNHPRPKAGVFAVRQGPPLEANLRRMLEGAEPVPFTPQREFLSLVSTGDRYAVASRSFWSFEGAWVWRWKDWIDRAFMRKFSELPEMGAAHGGADEADGAPGDARRSGGTGLEAPLMYCAGCGSKVGADVLSRALRRLDVPQGDDVLVGLQGADDAAVLRLPAGRVSVQTVDHFRAIVDDPFVNGRVTAVHALGDLWAMGATPQAALALVTLAHATEDKLEEDLVQLLAGALEVFGPAGVSLVGGHTNEGPETALGFALTGHADPDRLGRKGGLQPGNVLVLTKAVGTGALFAADMRGRAKGRWLDAALESMGQESGTAARILTEQGATAMTDITGFGLVGHLHEMLVASGCGARLRVDAVPALPGAAEVMAAGITSSLQPQNLRLRRAVTGTRQPADAPLLFDPQTAGGLLAGVPADRADAVRDALVDAGYASATIVGDVVTGDVAIELV